MATKPDLNEPITKGTLDEAVQAILQGMDGIANEIRKEMKAGFDEARRERKAMKDELKTEISFVKDDVRGLNAEFSTQPSRREFNKLKAKVDRYHTN